MSTPGAPKKHSQIAVELGWAFPAPKKMASNGMHEKSTNISATATVKPLHERPNKHLEVWSF